MSRNEKFAFFLPTRKGSERVQNKNTRTFAGIEGGLLKLKLNQLLEIDRVHILLFQQMILKQLRLHSRSIMIEFK